MKNAKRIISLMLSVLMAVTAFSYALSVYAESKFGDFEQYAMTVDLNTSYTRQYMENDPCYEFNNYSFHSFFFEIPYDGIITIVVESTQKGYFYYNERIYNENDIKNYIWSGTRGGNYSFNREEGVYYNSTSVNLKKGKYYFYKEYCNGFFNEGKYDDSYNITFNYKPNITKPASLNATSTTNSLSLSWSRIGNIDGYQLQRLIDGNYETIADTTNNSYALNGLSSATGYSFRVCAYKEINGTKYCSAWKTLNTATKPAKVGIKTPATNKKHQIIAKWNKVSGASGYQVQFAKNKSCSSVVANKTTSGASYTGKNFTKGKKYYVRVRAYKTVNGTKVYGAWSGVKAIKCK